MRLRGLNAMIFDEWWVAIEVSKVAGVCYWGESLDSGGASCREAQFLEELKSTRAHRF